MTTTNNATDAQTPTNATTTPHRGDTAPQTVQALAAKYRDLFTFEIGDGGEKLYSTQADRPAGLSKLIETVHGFTPLNYHTHLYIYDALRLIALSSAGEEANATDRIIADQYRTDLLQWLSSNRYRSAYVDDYIEESLSGNKSPEFYSLFDIISQGQYLERQEVFYSVLESLQKLTKRA